MVSKRTKELLDIDHAYLVHGFNTVGSKETWPIIERAEGVKIWDTDGNMYFDAGSQMCSNNLGHGQKEIVDAICRQTDKLQFAFTLQKQSNIPIIEYAQELAKVVPEGLAHFLFTNGGTESVEAAFKLARLYWARRGRAKYKIVTLYDSYHGGGFGGASATNLGRGHYWQGFTPLVPGFIQAPSFYCYRCLFKLRYPDCGIFCAHYIDEVIKAEGVDSVAAFIAEPVQGGAGNVAPPPEYFPIIREICTKNDVLLITDEVQTGFGKTGKMWATQHWDVKPDMVALGKGINSSYLPFGATIICDGIYETLKGEMLYHGHTHYGNPICAAAAKATLDIIIRDNLVENATNVGNYVVKRLNNEFKKLPNVDDIGGLGLMLGFEIIRDKETKTPFDEHTVTEWQRELLKRGLYIRPAMAGYNSRIRFIPPIVTTKEEADKMLDILYQGTVGLKSR